MLEHAAAALFLDPGLGKTAITLGALKILKARGLVNKVLIIAPLRVCYLVWPAEIGQWKDFHGFTYEVLHGPRKDDLLQNSDADIFIINPEGLEWLLQAKKTRLANGKTRVDVDLRRWKSLGFDTLVIDELSKFKHINTIRYKAMKQVLSTFARRWGLTGSPASNGLMDLFGQCFMLDEGRSLGRYITHYRKEYFNEGRDGFTYELRPGAEQQIYARIKPLALRMGEELIDMPTLVPNVIKVELPPEARKVYDALEDDLIARLDAGKVTAKTSAIASMKCRQVANGGVYLDQEVLALVKLPKSQRNWVKLHDAKTDALEDLVEELQGSPLLVAYDFGHDLERLRERFPKACFFADYKDMVALKRVEAEWNVGKIALAFGHPASIGHGLNLQEAGHHVAWYANTWDYELFDQFIRRVRRQGNKHKRVYCHFFVAEGTIDEVILAAQRSKKRGQDALFTALQARSRK